MRFYVYFHICNYYCTFPTLKSHYYTIFQNAENAEKPRNTRLCRHFKNFFAFYLTQRDDLGRVVIPKEIRRTMRIREGDPLEIYTSGDGEVIFRKYSPIGELSGHAGRYADVLYRMAGLPVVVCDRDQVIAAAGVPKKDYLSRRITPQLEKLELSRRSYLRDNASAPRISPAEGVDQGACVVIPVIADGDVTGSVMLLGDEPVTEVQAKLAQATASFLGRQMEI